jgi:hypothetical protein
MITAPDDNAVRTHDDARAVLQHAVPGAAVAFEPKTARSTAYQITVRRFGAPSLCVLGSYSLPALADRLAQHARAQVEREMSR